MSDTPDALCTPLSVVTTTVDSPDAAQHLARGAVQAQHAACAQVEAITSHYVWQGQLEASAEWRIVYKTLPAAAPALLAWLRAQHPYDVPQLLQRTELADAPYAAWVAQQVRVDENQSSLP